MNQTSPSTAGPECRVVFSARLTKGKTTSKDQNVAKINKAKVGLCTERKNVKSLFCLINDTTRTHWFIDKQPWRKTLYIPLVERGIVYGPSHIQDSTYHGLWYTSRGVLTGTKNSPMAWMGLQMGIDHRPTAHHPSALPLDYFPLP